MTRQPASTPIFIPSESGRYRGRKTEHATTTEETISNAVSKRFACAESSAALANNPIARTNSACVTAAAACDGACKAPRRSMNRNAAYVIQPIPQGSSYRSRKARKKRNLTTARIRAADSLDASQGTARAPTGYPKNQAGFIDTCTNARTCKYHAGHRSIPNFRLQMVTFGM